MRSQQKLLSLKNLCSASIRKLIFSKPIRPAPFCLPINEVDDFAYQYKNSNLPSYHLIKRLIWSTRLFAHHTNNLCYKMNKQTLFDLTLSTKFFLNLPLLKKTLLVLAPTLTKTPQSWGQAQLQVIYQTFKSIIHLLGLLFHRWMALHFFMAGPYLMTPSKLGLDGWIWRVSPEWVAHLAALQH